MTRIAGLVVLTALFMSPATVFAANEIKGEIASEVSTGSTGADGVRKSKDSDWTIFTAPENHVINKEKTEVHIISARGSEHSYDLQYDDYVEIIEGTDIKWPRTIRAKTHARSSKGHGGGGGGMKIKVHFTYVKYK